MKTKHLALVSLLGLATGFGLQAAPSKSANGANAHAEVIFFEPEKFTDAADTHMGDPNRSGYLDEMREHILLRARKMVPAGYKLAVTFTDVNLVGDFEPWRGPRADDIRIVKEIYPAHLKLAFRLTDAEGNVVKEGRRHLTDPSFAMKLTMASRSDPLRHEKELLDEWMRSELRSLADAPKA